MSDPSLLPDQLRSFGRVHIVGIGGIGMSGIAEVMHVMGYDVQGSDMGDNANTKRLRKMGLTVHTGHDAAHVAGAGGPPRWPSPESTALDPAGGAWASGAVFGDGGSAVGLKAGARTLERTFTLRSRATSAAAAGGMSAFHSSGALR